MELVRASEEQIKQLLVAYDAESRRCGLRELDQQYRERVADRLRRMFPSFRLHPENLADVWCETLYNMIEKVLSGNFKAEGSLLALLVKIARSRAIDLIRRTRPATNTLDTVLESISKTLQGSRTGDQWRSLDSVERNEVMELIQETVHQLPPQQKLVMQVFIEGFPESKSMECLRMAVVQQSHQQVTMAAVKRALQEARGKVRGLLRAKGYDLWSGGVR